MARTMSLCYRTRDASTRMYAGPESEISVAADTWDINIRDRACLATTYPSTQRLLTACHDVSNRLSLLLSNTFLGLGAHISPHLP